uniref:hypothetical protein n=1 Tax=Ignavibacterium sp. TaxID=2651167 RepID=UPI0025C01D74
MKFQILAILILISINLFPQSTSEKSNSDIYIFLESMRVKGLIEFHSELKPVNRKTLAEYLLKLEKEMYKLNATESEFLEKYKIDLEPELRLLTISDNEQNSDFLNTKKRLRFFEYYS